MGDNIRGSLPFLILFVVVDRLLPYVFLFFPANSRELYSVIIDATIEAFDYFFELKILPFLHFHMAQMANMGMALRSLFMVLHLLKASVIVGKEQWARP